MSRTITTFTRPQLRLEGPPKQSEIKVKRSKSKRGHKMPAQVQIDEVQSCIKRGDSHSAEDKEAANTLVNLLSVALTPTTLTSFETIPNKDKEDAQNVGNGNLTPLEQPIVFPTNTTNKQHSHLSGLSTNSECSPLRKTDALSDELNAIEIDPDSFGIKEECIEGLMHSLDPHLVELKINMDDDGEFSPFSGYSSVDNFSHDFSHEEILEENIDDVVSGFEAATEVDEIMTEADELMTFFDNDIDYYSDDVIADLDNVFPPKDLLIVSQEDADQNEYSLDKDMQKKDDAELMNKLQEADGVVKRLRNREHAKRSRARAQEIRTELEKMNAILESSNVKLVGQISKMRQLIEVLHRTKGDKQHRCVLTRKRPAAVADPGSCIKSCLKARTASSENNTVGDACGDSSSRCKHTLHSSLSSSSFFSSSSFSSSSPFSSSFSSSTTSSASGSFSTSPSCISPISSSSPPSTKQANRPSSIKKKVRFLDQETSDVKMAKCNTFMKPEESSSSSSTLSSSSSISTTSKRMMSSCKREENDQLFSRDTGTTLCIKTEEGCKRKHYQDCDVSMKTNAPNTSANATTTTCKRGRAAFPQSCNFTFLEVDRLYDTLLSPWDVQSKVYGSRMTLTSADGYPLFESPTSLRPLTYDVMKPTRKVSVLQFSRPLSLTHCS